MTTDTDERHTTWQLASMADCGSPDKGDWLPDGPPDKYADEASPGAVLLRHVEENARELYDDLRGRFPEFREDPEGWADHVRDWADYDGAVAEIADGAPSVYTHQRWAEFADLAAYNEDPTEYGYDPDQGMNGQAGICLYMIAERLAWALLAEWAEADEDPA